MKFLLSFCAVIILLIYFLKIFFPPFFSKQGSHVKKLKNNIILILYLLFLLKNVLAGSFKLEERYNWSYFCKQKNKTKRFSSSIIAFTGQSCFQFVKIQNINRALEPNMQDSEYAHMIFLKCKKPAHDKGTLDSADTLMHKALFQGHTVNSNI